MELKELLDYIKEKHNIEEHDRWDSFLTMSRLYHPLTGKMMALLIKEWNSNTGRWAEHCDLKYDASLFDRMKEYIVAPLRMHGSSWVGISFNDKTDRDHIFELFDKAVLQGNPSKDTALSDNRKSNTVYTDTPLPFAKGSDFLKKKEYIPEKITEMRKLYRYDDCSGQLSAKNFYRQAKFMEDYEDDYHGQVCDISGYFTTYHDLSDKQLRAYFTWRTEVRNGVYNKTFTSFIYLYIYELLCGIGSSSPVDSLNKLKEFEEKFIEGGFLEDSTQIKRNLHRWYLEYSLVKGFSVDEVKKYIEKDVLDRDHALEILKKSGNYNDMEIFEAISFFAGKRFLNSVSLKKEREKSIIIYAYVWKFILKAGNIDGKSIFTHCFGRLQNRSIYPLLNAVYRDDKVISDIDYIVNGVRSYHCKSGRWKEKSYIRACFNKKKLVSIVHEIDRLIRDEFKLGYYLKPNMEDTRIADLIAVAFNEAVKEIKHNERKRINVDFSVLKKIRNDAEITKTNLLVDEDIDEKDDIQNTIEKHYIEYDDGNKSKTENSDFNKISEKSDDINLNILKYIVAGKDYKQLIRLNNMFTSIITDNINEAFFEEIGDNILECEGDEIYLVEDYREDILNIIGEIYE
ncbi:hypothetical protein EHV10_07305 [Lachnoanaerobaculum gingivalis]|uniref:TerB-C domain-containing protein n=1 Tax=Lachnoanaerobaculum gingivalis TaxID=2490855 RepID=A0A3P3QW01_9FIRM|nr:TerB N-terminal domain-containing protein [Lachnoanaerobaculum gingivalis]RRJ25446.1 hypothetical protein EHV10_07305 [Lachnoanaerobaculum gingivalis]